MPKAAVDARLETLAKMQPHRYVFARPAVPVDARSDVLYRGASVRTPATVDCGRLGPVIGQITGRASEHLFTISGACFGTARGDVIMRDASGDHAIPQRSWSDSTITLYAVAPAGGSQTITMRVGVPKHPEDSVRASAAASGDVWSAPAQFAYVAPLVQHDGNDVTTNIVCVEQGLCNGWQHPCAGSIGTLCRVGAHFAMAVTKSADGIDLWRVRIKPGFTLDSITMWTDGAGLFIERDPSGSFVDVRVHWKLQAFDRVTPPRYGQTQPGDYRYIDGSYLFQVTLIGPDGVDP